MNKFKFLLKYILKPRSVGAVLPSSKYLANKMIKNINFDDAQYIVEYGPGTGVFTDKILQQRKKNTVLLTIERDAQFYKLLKEKYKDESGVYVVNDSAENIGSLLQEYDIPNADYIVSGLPFASLPRDVSAAILTQTQKCLKSGGRFITFQYTLLLKDMLMSYFHETIIERELRNVPPAYVFCCTKK